MEVGDLLVPSEVLLAILEFIHEAQDVQAFLRLCRETRDMVSCIRSLRVPSGKALKESVLHSISQGARGQKIRIQGPFVTTADDPRGVGVIGYTETLEDEVWSLSGRVHGDFLLYFSSYRRPSNITAASHLLHLLDLMFRVMISRALEYQDSEVRIVFGEGLEVAWRNSHCTLHIPVMWSGEEPSHTLHDLIAHLLRTVPITSFSYQGWKILRSNYQLAPCDGEDICLFSQYRFGPVIPLPTLLPITGTEIYIGTNNPFESCCLRFRYCGLWKALLSNVHTLRIRLNTPVTPHNLMDILENIPENSRRNITNIEGLHILCPGEREICFFFDMIRLFNPLMTWHVFLGSTGPDSCHADPETFYHKNPTDLGLYFLEKHRQNPQCKVLILSQRKVLILS